jgi:hypothetical protein
VKVMLYFSICMIDNRTCVSHIGAPLGRARRK